MLKTDKKPHQIQPEDIYPIGVLGKIEALGEDDTVKITTIERVMLSQIQATEIGITATSVPYPEEKDIDPDEEAEQFKNMKKELMSFAKDLQWGIWARGVIYHWQSFDEMAGALSSYFASSWEENIVFLNSSPEVNVSIKSKKLYMNFWRSSGSARKQKAPRRILMNRCTVSLP